MHSHDMTKANRDEYGNNAYILYVTDLNNVFNIYLLATFALNMSHSMNIKHDSRPPQIKIVYTKVYKHLYILFRQMSDCI